MKYTREEVLQYVQEEEVAFIHLTFCDVFGRQKNISIVPSELSGPLSTASPSTPPPSPASGTRPGPTCCSSPTRTL